MITLLYSLATRFWKPAFLIGVLGAAFIYREVIVHERDSAQAKLAESASQIADLTRSNKRFQTAVGECNSKVDSLQASAQRERQSAAAQAAAASQRAAGLTAAADAAAAAIAKDRVAAGCNGAIQWANQQGPELGRW